MRQCDFERPIICRAKADLTEIAQLILVEGLRIGDRVEHVSIIGSERGRENAMIRIDKVARDDRVAVRPSGVVSEMERVGFIVC